MSPKAFKTLSIIQRVSLYSLLAFLAIALVLAFVFNVYVPGWLFFIISVLLAAVFGSCLQLRGEAIIKGSKVGYDSVNGNLGVSMFPEPGPIMALKSFEIFQVHTNGQALAFSSDKDPAKRVLDYHGPTVLFMPDKNQPYYDKLVITVPGNKVVRQVGTYRYDSREGVKTVPIVSILDK